MLSISHIIIIVIFAIIFLGPDKIPQFFKSIAEGLLIFKNTFNGESTKSKNKKIKNNNNKSKKKKIKNR